MGIEQINGEVALDDDRIRREGGGRKSILEIYPTLEINAELDSNSYQKGIKITDEELAKVNIVFHEVNEKLNYTISPIYAATPFV